MNISDANSRIQGINSMISKLTLLLLACGFLLVIIIFGVIANITVCVIMVRGRRFKKHLSNSMLLHLSITDIVYRLIVVPAQLTAVILPMGNDNKALLCKVAKTLLSSVHTAIFTSLVVIALDRHHSITKPFQRLTHKPKFCISIMAVWGYSIVSALPHMYTEGNRSIASNFTFPSNGVTDNITYSYSWHVCSPSTGFNEKIFATVYFVLGFLVPLVIITIAYSKIAVYLWRKSRNGTTNQAALKSKGKAFRMLVLLVFGFVVCLGAPQLKDLMSSFGFDFQAFSLVAVVLQILSSLINPLIYGFYSAEFKLGLQNLKIS